MNIKIQNLGAIKEACINLNKRLTVFCGPNNTGKTYVSYIIYALTNENMSLPLLLDEKLLQQFLETGKFGLDLDIDKLYEFRENQLKLIRDSLDSIFGISEEKVKSYFSDFSISFLVDKDEFKQKILAEEFSLMVPVNDLVVNVVKKHPTCRLPSKMFLKRKLRVATWTLFVISCIRIFVVCWLFIQLLHPASFRWKGTLSILSTKNFLYSAMC